MSPTDTPLDLAAILDRHLKPGAKGMPAAFAPLAVGDVGRQGWNLLADDVTLPAAILLDRELRHNAAAMAVLVQKHDIHIAPHGKTTMAPQLFRRQLDAGAWALSAATPAHLACYLAIGVRRIIYANQLVDPGALALLCEALGADPGLEVFCLVDGRASAALLAQAADTAGLSRPIDVLIEMGMPGGRTGLRSSDAAVALADHIAREMPRLRVRGVEAFEGIVPFDEAGRAKVDTLIDGLETAAEAMRQRIAPLPPILSIGGSAFFPLIVDRLRNRANDMQIVLRSGCYLIHDHGMYEAGRASPCCHGATIKPLDLRPALEVWGHVQSRPEPGKAYVTIGKRDISHDAGMPTPIKWSPRGSREAFPLTPGDARVVQLNDQHAYLEIRDDHPMTVGDRLALGCSHPCTTFDKWDVLHVVDDRYAIVEAIATCF